MLGRLIQTAASYGKNNAALESATEEAHTRHLLYGQSQHIYALAQSPPGSPLAAPPFRPGSFDDRGGLELDEKELRIVLAQDAFGTEEKPTILFDSSLPSALHQSATAHHARHASTVQAGHRVPLPPDWRPGTPTSPVQTNADAASSFRYRSSTISGAPSAWTRPVRDAGTREEAFLECMFGVVNSTRTTSTTKMHLMLAKSNPAAQTATNSTISTDSTDNINRRVPLARSRTSGTLARNLHSSIPSLDTDNASHDAVLITRLFNVSLPESVAPSTTDQTSKIISQPLIGGQQGPALREAPDTPSKKPKLVERKVPSFAIGLVLYLPRNLEARQPAVRPASRSAYGYNISSASSSFGSDMQNSWTFLDAIPESLASSRCLSEETDRRIELVVNNWDVILRAISALEKQATAILYEQLIQVLNRAAGPSIKLPKEKSMQRINQRIVSITDPSAIAGRPSLQRAVKHLVNRICYALRVPRVTTGLGFAAGHWSDEARMLHRLCGRRQQNFFLFNLLTAFLGNHTQWLARLGPDWYRKQYRTSNKQRSEPHLLGHRTVIISDQRSIARRLIFLLASFMPGNPSTDGLHKASEDPGFPMLLSASSPSSHMGRQESLRRTANRRVRESRLQMGPQDKLVLSSSASSTESAGASHSKNELQRQTSRKDSDSFSLRGPSRLSGPDAPGQSRKASAAVTSATTPNPATPVAYFATRRDSYFPEGVIAETSDSIASADLAKILRRSSSSGGTASNVSSRWGSLVSGITDLWSARDIASDRPRTPAGLQATVSRSETSPRSRNFPRSTSMHQSPALDADRGMQPPSRAIDTRTKSDDHGVDRQSKNTTRSFAKAPQMSVDDEDGVVDVDLDPAVTPNFWTNGGLISPRRSHRPSVAGGFDGTESIRSLRSLPTDSPRNPIGNEGNAAGYLRRFHEDFVLHATRPYSELESDIRASMSKEPSPPVEWINQIDIARPDKWTNVCTTLVADVRTFSVKRITLRRKLEIKTEDPGSRPSTSTGLAPANSGIDWNDSQEDFVEEEIKDFDTVLADAVERALNLVENLTPASGKTVRPSHVRSESASTTATAQSMGLSTSARTLDSTYGALDYGRQDCRLVVMNMLEDIAKEVNDDLSKLQKGRDIHGARSFDVPAVKAEMKQENILREGVKRWLLNVEQTRVW